MPVLTDEEIAALEQELLTRERPIGVPPTLPFGPSPEFLRREATMGGEGGPSPRVIPPADWREMAPPGWGRGAVESFDPATGRREQFMSVSPPPSRATQQFEAMERLREQANTMRYKNELDAKNAAMTFMATQAYQEAMGRGEDPRTAAAVYGRYMFGQAPAVVPRFMDAATPTPQPRVINVGGGRRALVSGRDQRASVVPEARAGTAAMQEIAEADLLEDEARALESTNPEEAKRKRANAVILRNGRRAESEPRLTLGVGQPNVLGEYENKVSITPSQYKKHQAALEEMGFTIVKPAGEPPASERVAVLSPEGKPGTIPRSQLNEALAKGFKTR